MYDPETNSYFRPEDRISQEEMLKWELEIYLRSCWLYYHSDYQAVLDDATHDATERILQEHFEELPEWFKAQVPNKLLKPAAHALKIPEDVQERAIEWSKNKYNVCKS